MTTTRVSTTAADWTSAVEFYGLRAMHDGHPLFEVKMLSLVV